MSKKKENSFPKHERICNVEQISSLFEKGSSFICYPVRVVWLVKKNETNISTKVLISVSKKKLKHAVDRNRAKRLIKEAYRLNKALVSNLVEPGNSLFIAFIWLPEDFVSFAKVNKKVSEALKRIKINICEDEVDRNI